MALLVLVLGLAAAAVARPVELKEAELSEGAQAPRDVAETVWFQGFLADSGTNEPIDATYTVIARIYNAPSGGTLLWGPETHNGVSIVRGWFNIELGSIASPLPAFDDPPYYLALWVNGEALTPRLKLGSVPSAFQAHSADESDGDWLFNSRGIATFDTVGIGTSYGDQVFTITPVWYGDANFIRFKPYIIRDRLGEGSLIGHAGGMNYQNLWIVNQEPGGWVGMGAADFPTVGITDSTQLYSTIYPFMGYPPGYFSSDGGSIGDIGAFIGSSQEYDGAVTLYAEYYGSQQESWATAVYGDATYGDSWTIGGEFHGTAYGVDAIAEGTNSPFMYGLCADVDNTGGDSACFSVYADDPETDTGTGYSGYFIGDVYVGGTLTGGGPSLKIDHPLDPANKYLCHSAVESPDMMNVYNGNVALDASGEAVVELPEWFEALNRDFRYQLTCVGGFAPVYVADEISANQFRIAGGEPGMKVSWMVTGIRHDSYAEANRLPVEQDKVGYEVGRYLHPEAFGLPGTEREFYVEQFEQAKVERAQRNADKKAERAEKRAASAERAGKGWWRQ